MADEEKKETAKKQPQKGSRSGEERPEQPEQKQQK